MKSSDGRRDFGQDAMATNNFGGDSFETLEEDIEALSQKMYEGFPKDPYTHLQQVIAGAKQEAVAEMGLHPQPLDPDIDKAVDPARIIAG